MPEPFTDKPGESLLGELRRLFETKPVFLKKDQHIVFVCGGPTNTRKAMRRRFLDWSKTNFPEIIPILAEDAFKPTEFYKAPSSIDLARFESIMGDIADCVIVFPESAGSYAEVGYFAERKISAKILIANSRRHELTDSFLNRGPIRLIDRDSYLQPAVHLPHMCMDFSPLRQRLRRIIGSKKRHRFKYKPFWEMDYKGKFLAALQLISIFQPIDLEGLNLCVKGVFQETKEQQVGHIVGVLHGAGYVSFEDDIIKMRPNKQPLLEIQGTEMDRLRLRVLLYYKKSENH